MSVLCMSDSDMSVVCTSDYRHVCRYSLCLCTFCGYIFCVNKTSCFCEFFCDPSHLLCDVFFSCRHDLDNIVLEKLGNAKTMYAVYELEALVLTGG